jgi:predicted permease
MSLIGRALSNPVTIGSLVGLTLSVTGWQLPEVIAKPVGLVGAIAVPGMLIAFGISLRLDPRPGHGQAVPHVGAIVAITMVVQPLAAYLFGRWPLGMSGHELLAVTMVAALPTAQTVFLLAAHYRQGVLLARDSVFVSTLLAVPVVLVITALLS